MYQQHTTNLITSAILCGTLAGAAEAGIRTWQPIGGNTTWGSSLNWTPIGVPGLTDTAVIDNGGLVFLNSVGEAAELQIRNGSYFSTNSNLFNVTLEISVMDDGSYFGVHSDVTAGSVVVGPEATLDINSGSLTTDFVGLQSGALMTAGGTIDFGSNPLDVIDLAEDSLIVVPFGKTLTFTGGGQVGFSADDEGEIHAIVGDVVFDTWDSHHEDAYVVTRVGAGHSLTTNAPLHYLGKRMRVNLEGGAQPAQLIFDDFISHGWVWARSGQNELIGTKFELRDLPPDDDGFAGQLRIDDNASVHVDLTSGFLRVVDGAISMIGPGSEITGTAIQVDLDGHIGGEGRIGSQRLDLDGRLAVVAAGELIIDTMETFDLDGPHDAGELDVSNQATLRITDDACPPFTVFDARLYVDGNFVME